MRLALTFIVALTISLATVTVMATAATVRPSRAQIDAIMKRTVEASDHHEHFSTLGRPIEITVGDGKGGSLTAVLGTRFPTADGYGQLVFFWHDGRFIGWNSRFEAIAVISIKAVGASVQVKFAHYRKADAFCCPSLPPVTVSYRWSGSRLIASGTPPRNFGLAAVRLLQNRAATWEPASTPRGDAAPDR